MVPITYNPPTVGALGVAPRVMPGFPVVASVEVLYADVAACEWEWLRVPPAECAPLYLVHSLVVAVVPVVPDALLQSSPIYAIRTQRTKWALL